MGERNYRGNQHASGDRPSRLAHLPALDGLRGLAVIAVVLFHSGAGPFQRGGFLGVDLFFVISGFLITSLLLVEHRATGRVDLWAFWGRRIRRLAPALLLVLCAVALYGRLELSADALDRLRGDLLAATGYVANWRFVADNAGYFEALRAPSPVQHTWSLAIEEQFYLLWPLMVVGLLTLGRGRHRWLLGATVAGVMASAIASAWLHTSGDDPARVYFGTDTRAHALLIGAALGIALTGRPARADRWRRVIDVGGIVAAGGLAWAWMTVRGSDDWLFEWGFVAVAVASAVLVLAVVHSPRSLLARGLSWRPLAAIGVVSYGIYLWHWPVIIALTNARTGLAGAWLLGARLVLTATLAVVSYFVIERPIRHGWRPALAARTRLVRAGWGPVAVAAVILAAVWSTSGAGDEGDGSHLVSSTGIEARPASSEAPAASTDVLLLGDSVSFALGAGWGTEQKETGAHLALGAVIGCGVVSGSPVREHGVATQESDQCPRWEELWQHAVATADPDVVVLLVGRWEVRDRHHDGEWMHVGQPAYDAYLREALGRGLDIAASPGAPVVVLTTPYYGGLEAPDGSRFAEDDPGRVDVFNEILRQSVGAAQQSHLAPLSLLDLNEVLAPHGHFVDHLDGIELYNEDRVHLSVPGAAWVWEQILPPILAAAAHFGDR